MGQRFKYKKYIIKLITNLLVINNRKLTNKWNNIIFIHGDL